jgi:hypothetical protein
MEMPATILKRNYREKMRRRNMLDGAARHRDHHNDVICLFMHHCCLIAAQICRDGTNDRPPSRGSVPASTFQIVNVQQPSRDETSQTLVWLATSGLVAHGDETGLGRVVRDGDPGRARTCDPRFRKTLHR